MILQHLNDFYYRLLEYRNPDTGLAPVPPHGFSEENISYCLVLSKDGDLLNIQDIRESNEHKIRPKRLNVPQSFKRPGTAPRPFYLWDKTSYVLGVERSKNRRASSDALWEISLKNHKAFVDLHLEWLKNQSSAELIAVRQFLLAWNPDRFSQHPFSLEHLDSNLVFRVEGHSTYVHESIAARELWLSLLTASLSEKSRLQRTRTTCLITGDKSHLSRLHPAIKGVYGGQSSGGSLVSFNAEAYESLGKTQGENAPVSERAAFAYTTALNYLLRREKGHCLLIAGTSTVFWAKADNIATEIMAIEVFSSILNPATHTLPSGSSLRTLVAKLAQGERLEDIIPELDPDIRFFILGLAPNSSRISVRYWFDGNFREVGEHLSEHWFDMQIAPLPWATTDPPSIWRFLIETAPAKKSENICPKLTGEWLRSILTGSRYPRQLLTHIIQRLRSDGDINGLRAALIKSVLARDYRKGFTNEVIPMSLDIMNSPVAYRLGCLFAVLEQAQRKARGYAKLGITNRYYSTAAAVPYSIFPRLIAAFQNCLLKVYTSNRGHAIYLEQQMISIMSGLPNSLPKHLTIEQQGQFAVGYYHQKQSFVTERTDQLEHGSDQTYQSNGTAQ